MIVEELFDILDSAIFKDELQELSMYAASMKQERPIALLLSKLLWQRGYKAAPELRKCDLDVEGRKIELKFHYDADIPGICAELGRHGITSYTLEAAIKEGKLLHPTWSATPGLYKDIYSKLADIFIWVICSRDLSSLSHEASKRVCCSSPQINFHRNAVPYSRRNEVFHQAEVFIKQLANNRRACSVQSRTIETFKTFPSSYHFVLSDFTGCDS